MAAATRKAVYAEVGGVHVPALMYGTAWKEDRTAGLVGLALAAGFRAIDTANQRKHYHEAGVGEALSAAKVERADLFLQTKFTHVDGQDHRLPYDATKPLATQVEQSFASSLTHLGVERLDSYVLHGPSGRGDALDADDWETWRAMERLQQAGKTRLLGISNVSLGQLQELYANAAVKPAMVQNRCYAARGWDGAIRAFCRERNLLYQGFSLLTANRDVLRDKAVDAVVKRAGRTLPQVIFRFAIQAGMIVLTGTTSAAHMAEDQAVYDFELEPRDVLAIENVGGR